MSSAAAPIRTLNLYGYVPNFGGSVFFVVTFSLLTLAHLFLTVKSRRYWTIPFILGGVCEIIGFISRAISSQTTNANLYTNTFLAQQVTLILGPTFFSAGIYALLGMLIMLTPGGASFSKLEPRRYIAIFVTCDVFALILQAVGGGMAAVALKSRKASLTGTNIMVGGIAFQLVSMLVFAALATNFFWRARHILVVLGNAKQNRGVRRLIIGISIGTILILIRCVYRVIELAQGWTGYLITNEPYFIVLDAVPMLLCLACFVVTHPYFTLPAIGETIELLDSKSSPASSIPEKPEEQEVTV